MYEAFYGLREKPFVMHPDPYFVYWSPMHSMAYAMLEYGILGNQGFTVITGEIGCGKTMLLRCLLTHLDDAAMVGLLSSTSFKETELLQWILMSFGQEFENRSNVALYRDFQNFLITQYANKKRVILVVDEAQNLGAKVLEELRMLSNINADAHQLLQVILLGQPQLRKLLADPALEQFSQRIGADYHVAPLSTKEVEKYISHRLKIAGGRPDLFSKEATDVIAAAAKGVPRSINLLCDAALVYGFASQQQSISVDVARQVISDRVKNSSLSSWHLKTVQKKDEVTQS